MAKDETKQSNVVACLITALITILLAVASMGAYTVNNKLDTTVYTEHKEAQIRQEQKTDRELEKINGKLDTIIEKIK